MMGVGAPSDLAGGGGEPFCPKKIHNARILEFCNRDTKALILYEKEKRLPFSRLVERF